LESKVRFQLKSWIYRLQKDTLAKSSDTLTLKKFFSIFSRKRVDYDQIEMKEYKNFQKGFITKIGQTVLV
jgi:hypothetical protein